MAKRKVLIAIHQLNIGGAQKALISALNAIDYSKNEVTLYVRKNRLDLLSQVNQNVSKIIINEDHTKYYRKPYSVILLVVLAIKKVLNLDSSKTQNKLNEFIVNSKMMFEKRRYFSDDTEYDVAVSYIQGYTAQAVTENVRAKKKVLFYHDSTDSLHEIHNEVFKSYDSIYCVSKGAMQAVKGFYPQFADKIDYLENFVDYKKIRKDAKAFVPDYQDDRITLCTCGRMTNVKGYDLAVKAAKILKDRGLLFEWYFVGDGVERANIEHLIQECGLNDNIVITGLVDNPYAYVNNADIYVQPSYEESYGLAIVEAMIMCVPVVSTATVGGNTVVSDGVTGVIADINDKSLADAIEKMILNVDDRETMRDYLLNVDYSKEKKRYEDGWIELLQ